jgi:hypothetical protein
VSDIEEWSSDYIAQQINEVMATSCDRGYYGAELAARIEDLTKQLADKDALIRQQIDSMLIWMQDCEGNSIQAKHMLENWKAALPQEPP